MQTRWTDRYAQRTHGMTSSLVRELLKLTGFVDSYADKVMAEETVKRVRGERAVANDVDVRVGDERTDPEIAKDAVRALESHTRVPNRVTVAVRHGFVTLEGTVEWMYQKDAAESAVKYLKGVRNVSNLIRISQLPASVEVRSRIEQALQRSADVEASRVRIVADDGTVTLSGQVHSWAERKEAERAAWSCPGVMRVKNELTVAA